MPKMDRRQLLQFFGIGTVITPMLNGTPLVEAAASLLAVPQVQPLVTDSFPSGHVPQNYLDRLRWNAYEALWLKMWQIENNPPSWLNNGVGPLEHVLMRPPTDAEKTAVAAVIQWFGSNCGHCFIEEALKHAGYRLRFDETLPHAMALRDAHNAAIWHSKPLSVGQMEYRGRKMTLGPEESIHG
jgi:hypothetical protein